MSYVEKIIRYLAFFIGFGIGGAYIIVNIALMFVRGYRGAPPSESGMLQVVLRGQWILYIAMALLLISSVLRAFSS
jgi:hypothetical protein